ncbi:hypothetical protein LZ198_20280 [Myxococcus sp. K15C18031901]|uniref:hypothetical protein n=1 Tax=Myxococcus dinghuensis TaxID=2906761 RepID=UPI0020A6FB90|nr:hypothetical protein [Myxococcus dinghuensis]MCP3101219.1 hypothetical protein [Myxococcus dinghuensis]
MGRVLSSLGVATGLTLVLVACGIKGAPKPPLPAPAPTTEAPPPPSDTRERSVGSAGPSITPDMDGGALTPTTFADSGTP